MTSTTPSTSSAASSLISSLNSSASTTTLANTTGTGAGSALSVDSNEWLALLTTQLKYQDPMQPTDSTQFVAELAQFNGVQQQVQTNTTLSSIQSQLSAGSLGQAASLIGRSVQASAGTYVVPSSGGASSATYKYAITNAALKNPSLTVTNASGSVVATVPVSAGSGSVSFGGTGSNGASLPAGSYTLALQGTDSTGASETAGTLNASGTVTQVLQGAANSSGTSGGWQLLLDNGSTVDASSVTELSSS